MLLINFSAYYSFLFIQLIARKFNIEEKVKPMSEFMKGVKVTNSSTAKNYYAINGNVKSLAKMVMNEDQLPCPFLMYCLYIQHVILYGITYGKSMYLENLNLIVLCLPSFNCQILFKFVSI